MPAPEVIAFLQLFHPRRFRQETPVGRLAAISRNIQTRKDGCAVEAIACRTRERALESVGEKLNPEIEAAASAQD